MAKLISLMHISFDGFAAAPNGAMDWISFDEKIFEYVSKYISKVDTGIYGPKTFGMMEAHWPKVLSDSQADEADKTHAKWYQNAKKIVCSQTVKDFENKDVKLISTNLQDEITKLKEQSSHDMMVFGSPRLTQSLARLDLFDEHIINVNPILLGDGIRMFEDLPKTKLAFISVTPFDNGVIGFHYKKR